MPPNLPKKAPRKPLPGDIPDNQMPGGPPGPGSTPSAMDMSMPLGMPPGMMGLMGGPQQQAPFIPAPDARPGRGMDAVRAMQNGLGPDPMAAGYPPADSAPLGSEGLPIGGFVPPNLMDNDADDRMGGSDLLQALVRAAAPQGDPYTQPPGGPDQGFQGMGTGDPNMGMAPLLQLLALAQMGVGGQKHRPTGVEGMDMQPSNVGGMVGLGGGPY